MSSFSPSVLPAVLQHLESDGQLLILVLDAAERVREASAGASALAGRDLVGLFLREVFCLDSLELQSLGSQSYPMNLELLREGEAPLPMRIRFIRQSSDVLLCIGQRNTVELEGLQHTVMSLNRELNKLAHSLQKSNAELGRLNELKTQFLGMAAHDLRKPIGLILAYSQMLVEDLEVLEPGTRREFLSVVVDSAYRMKRLVDDFLNVAIIESGRLELNRSSIKVAEIIAGACQLVMISSRKREIAIRMEIDSALPALEGDGPKLEQAIANLLANAVEHSPPEGEVVLRAVQEAQRLIVSVTDMGGGIPEPVLSRLFQPLVRASVRRTMGDSSVGLGLVIARRVVEAHQGRIWVENRPGEGATFIFSIPLGNHGGLE